MVWRKTRDATSSETGVCVLAAYAVSAFGWTTVFLAEVRDGTVACFLGVPTTVVDFFNDVFSFDREESLFDVLGVVFFEGRVVLLML